MAKNRYESELKKIIAELLISQISDPRLGWVTVSSVVLSKDYQKATVFVSVIGNQQESLEVLNNACGFIRTLLSKRLPWRRVPKLSFELEEPWELKGEQGYSFQ